MVENQLLPKIYKMTTQEILDKLPFSPPYLFVDELLYVNEKGASGCYTFKEDLDFFKGHFKNFPVVPGAILIETMAQIGGASVSIYLSSFDENKKQNEVSVATSYNVEFFKPVYPNDKVTVVSEIVYFRFGKLKTKVVMTNERDEKVCEGVIAGILAKQSNL